MIFDVMIIENLLRMMHLKWDWVRAITSIDIYNFWHFPSLRIWVFRFIVILWDVMIFVLKKMLILRSFTRCIFIVKQIVFIRLLIISLTYAVIMAYLFVLMILFLTFYIDMKEVIFLIFNSETFFKRYARSSSVISYSEFEEILLFFLSRFDEYRILKVTYFQLRKLYLDLTITFRSFAIK